MKTRLLSLILAVSFCLPLISDNYNLGDPGSGWGDTTYDTESKVIYFPDAWVGKGWWFSNQGMDISDYTNLIINIKSSNIDAQVVVQYIVDNDKVKEDAVEFTKNDNTVEIKLKKEEYSNLIQQIYIQSKEAGSITLDNAYLSEQDIKYIETEIPMSEHGNVLLSDLANYDDECRVELRVNVKTSGNTAPGWGIGRITAIGGTENEDNAIKCKAISDEGEVNIFAYKVAALRSIALSDGDNTGININVWTGEKIGLFAMKVDNGEQEPGEDDKDNGIIIPMDEYGGVKLSELEKYADDRLVKITLIATKAEGSEAGPGWGMAAICPFGNYDLKHYTFNCIAISAEGSENVYEFSVGELKEFSKIDGIIHTDEYGNQGITINTWGISTRKDIKVYPELSATAISDNISDQASVIAIEYYNLLGARIATPDSGIYIRKETLSNGKSIVKKIMTTIK